MINRHARQVDSNQTDIVAYLRANGIYVKVNSGAGELPDLIVKKQQTGFLEIKVQGSKACYTRLQIQFIADTKLHVGIATNEKDALAFALEPERFGLFQSQKDALAAFLMRQSKDKKRFSVAEIQGVLNK